jgi:hypothetical protein
MGQRSSTRQHINDHIGTMISGESFFTEKPHFTEKTVTAIGGCSMRPGLGDQTRTEPVPAQLGVCVLFRCELIGRERWLPNRGGKQLHE